MDVYSLTRKKRPSHPTLAQSSRMQSSSDSALDVSLSGNISKANSRLSSNYVFDEVTGSPTREHWKRDADANSCNFLACATDFGLFERRHHCRKCGNIFCSQHCSNYFRLDQFSQFHPHGVLSRGCDTCAVDYVQWQVELRQIAKENISRRASTATNTANISDTNNSVGANTRSNSLKKRHAGIMTQQPQAMEGVTELGRDDIVLPTSKPSPSKGLPINNKAGKKDQAAFNPIPSVPADWQWSTF